MERYYKKILIVGKKPSSRVEGVDHVADDLVSLAKMNKRHHYDLIVIIPSKTFFQKTPGVRLTPVELARPGVSDIDSDSPEDLIAKLAIRAFHSLIMASLSNTDVVVFYSKEGQQFPWKLSMAQSAHCGICSLAPNDYDHPLLSLPWSELVPQGEYIFRTNKIHRLKDLLGITDFRLPDKTTVSCRKMLFNMSGLLSQEITISCPFQNSIDAGIAILGTSSLHNGCFLVMPSPYDFDETLLELSNVRKQLQKNTAPEQPINTTASDANAETEPPLASTQATPDQMEENSPIETKSRKWLSKYKIFMRYFKPLMKAEVVGKTKPRSFPELLVIANKQLVDDKKATVKPQTARRYVQYQHLTWYKAKMEWQKSNP